MAPFRALTPLRMSGLRQRKGEKAPSTQLEAENDALRQRIAALERLAQSEEGTKAKLSDGEEDDEGEAHEEGKEMARDSSDSSDSDGVEVSPESASADAIAFARAAARMPNTAPMSKIDKFFLWTGITLVISAVLFVFHRMGTMVYKSYLVNGR